MGRTGGSGSQSSQRAETRSGTQTRRAPRVCGIDEENGGKVLRHWQRAERPGGGLGYFLRCLWRTGLVICHCSVETQPSYEMEFDVLEYQERSDVNYRPFDI